MEPIHTIIKQATKEAHQNLEKKVVLRLKSLRSEADYADLLKCFFSYFHSLEHAMSPYLSDTSVIPDYAERRSSLYIKNDIIELGANIDQLPACSVPEINNAAGALGALYVREGSTMGGSIIVKMLQEKGITKGVSFFSGYGPATGAMWGSFLNTLDLNTSTEETKETAISTAQSTFEHFSRVFTNQSATITTS